MSDEADMAQAAEEMFRADAIRKAKPQTPTVPARRYCECCGEHIPAARRKAVPGAQRCTECQAHLERRVA